MSKINPLHKIIGIPEERPDLTKKPDSSRSADKSFRPDRVEISADARLVQKAEGLQKIAADEPVEDAHRVGNQWYRYGYGLVELEGME